MYLILTILAAFLTILVFIRTPLIARAIFKIIKRPLLTDMMVAAIITGCVCVMSFFWCTYIVNKSNKQNVVSAQLEYKIQGAIISQRIGEKVKYTKNKETCVIKDYMVDPYSNKPWNVKEGGLYVVHCDTRLKLKHVVIYTLATYYVLGKHLTTL